MDYTYYLFAGFVFLLTVLAAYIIIKAITDKKLEAKERKEQARYNDKEKRLFSLYQNLEDMIVSIEKYIEESMSKVKSDREEADKTLAEVKQIYEKIKTIESKQEERQVDKLKPKIVDPASYKETITTAKIINKYKPDEPKEHTADVKMDKIDIVRQLYAKGLDVEQISRKMGMSQGEVSLIVGIKK